MKMLSSDKSKRCINNYTRVQEGVPGAFSTCEAEDDRKQKTSPTIGLKTSSQTVTFAL